MTQAAEQVDQPAERKLRHPRQARWREANPFKRWAHDALRSGLRRGLLTKQPCEVCGAEEAEAHHPDYDKPLVVKWLCRPHHRAVHARKRAA